MDLSLFKIIKFNSKRQSKLILEIKIFSILNKTYFFDKLEKNAWCTILKYNLSELVNNPTSLSISAADFGITMISIGLKKYGLKHINRSMKISKVSNDQKNIAFSLSRKAIYYLFFDEPQKSIKTLEESIEITRSIGGMWELMTSLGTLGQNYYNIGEHKKSIEAYSEVGSIAKKLNSQSHQGWMYCKVPFVKYLLNELDYDNAVKELNEGIKISTSCRDLMNLCIIYGHLTEIAKLEDKPDKVAEYMQKVVHFNDKYNADVPHSRMTLINACEAALYLINRNYRGLTKKELLKIAKRSLKKIYPLSKNNRYLLGPVLRAHSIYELTRGREKKSKKLCLKALKVLKPTPYKREYALTLKHAILCFKDENDSYKELVDNLLTDTKL